MPFDRIESICFAPLCSPTFQWQILAVTTAPPKQPLGNYLVTRYICKINLCLAFVAANRDLCRLQAGRELHPEQDLRPLGEQLS